MKMKEFKNRVFRGSKYADPETGEKAIEEFFAQCGKELCNYPIEVY